MKFKARLSTLMILAVALLTMASCSGGEQTMNWPGPQVHFPSLLAVSYASPFFTAHGREN